MTKEKIIKDLEPILYGASLFTVADTLFVKIEQEKKDIFKEFVEWLKARFDKRIDEQTAKCERIENEGDDGTYLTSYLEYLANNEGILTGFVNAKWWLEELDTIEKFSEEAKDDKGKDN